MPRDLKNNKNSKTNKESSDYGSLFKLAGDLAEATGELMRAAKSEEDLRLGFESVLNPILKSIGIETKPSYEHFRGEKQVLYSGLRPDAVHGGVIIEYEAPSSFKSQGKIDHAHEQLVGYMTAYSTEGNKALGRIVGVGFDGERIFFVQHRKDKFFQLGPYLFDTESAITLLAHLRGLARLPLTAENLAQRFGPDGELAPEIVSALADALENWDNKRIRIFFNEWKRIFGIVYGEQLDISKEKEAQILTKLYNVGSETDFQELLFSVHTYFALLMKLIAAEILYFKETSLTASLSHKLAHASDKDTLLNQLKEMESGGIYAKRGITNFLEGDFFKWYLDSFSPRLEDAIRKMARVLSDFEPATTIINPDASRDLIKKLYQYLVPREIRQKLGEYYTPDWLAELVIKEVGYTGDSRKRVLDPACGSGTFLVLAIQKARQYEHEHREPKLEIAKRVVRNIWGFDINPMAVIAARTNYLFALGDLAHELQSFEIPIYIADSVLTPTRTTSDLFGEFLEVSTSVHKFRIPAIWIKDGGFMLSRAVPILEDMIKQQYEVDEAMKRFKNEGLVFPPHEQIVSDFYRDLLKLEKEGKNNIWVRFLKNAFAPVIANKFDYVVGNPPWIRWGYLSQEYRQATLSLWKEYGLFSLKGHAARLGGGEKDFSMLFTYAAADYYLKNGAKLGFLITQEVFKSKGAGEGFRRFQLGDNGHLKVLKAHDLVSIQPFEGAANKTAAIILEKGKKTEYPLPYYVWTKKKGIGKIATDKLLNEVLLLLQRRVLMAQPMSIHAGSWQTIPRDQKDFGSIAGQNYYKARRGAETDPYGIFLLEVGQVFPDKTVLIKNCPELGKQNFPKVEERIEIDLVFPLIRGSDLERWGLKSFIYALITQDPTTRNGFLEEIMKSKWPRTYGYLARFKNELLARATYKKFHEATQNPFYSQYNIAEYTFTRFKTVWKSMASDVESIVVSSVKTPFAYKSVVPFKTTSYFSTNDESEAHYLCAIINSVPVRDFIKSYSSAGRGFGTPSVMEHVGIPKFDPKDSLHQQLSEISKKCHQLKAERKEKEVEKLEKENDELVKKLFKIK